MTNPQGTGQAAQPGFAEERVEVTILVDGDGKLGVRPDPARITKNQEIEWTSALPKFGVKFKDGGPFERDEFDKGSPKSGKPKVEPDDKKKYKYTVSAQGHQPLDPDVIVGP